MENQLNEATENLAPYPMEELKKIKAKLMMEKQPIFDFGTGDPNIPIADFIVEEVRKHTNNQSGYPSVAGLKILEKAHRNYLTTTLGLPFDETLMVLPTRGSKEAVFHTTLCAVGRKNKRRIIYPDPGYPVYKSSTLFARGIPTPFELTKDNEYLLEPWKLEKSVIKETAAIWINYPHNPTGKTVDNNYLAEFVKFCRSNDILILSDDCYIDIYHSNFDKSELKHKRPPFILQFGSKNIISLLSLSKRSGLTSYRAGLMVGDAELMKKLKNARANMGLAQTSFISHGAAAAWNDEVHVKKRRCIFTERLDCVSSHLAELGIEHIKPEATFYIWAKIPEKYPGDDIKFCLDLASKGIICSPSSWLSENCKGWFRMAMVPDLSQTKTALALFADFVRPYAQ